MNRKVLLAGVALATVLGLVQTSSALVMETFAEDLRVFYESGGSPTGNGYANSQAAEASFLAQLIGVGTETFESYSSGQGAPLGLTFPGAGTATLAGSGNISSTAGAGRNAISGSKWWETAGNDFTITFGAPVAAFGFYGVDVGDFTGVIALTLAGGGVHTVTLPTSSGSAAAGNVIYYGYINTDTPFTSVTFDYAGPTGGGADYFGFDNMTIGSVQQVVATPDGGLSLMLLGSAFAGIAVFRRKFA